MMIHLSPSWTPKGPDIAIPSSDEAWFFIGDVHGHWQAYKDLLRAFARTKTKGARRLITLGDVIHKGPNSLACLDATLTPKAQKMAHCDTHIRLWGNHEILFARALSALYGHDDASWVHGWKGCGGQAFLNEVPYSRYARDGLKRILDSLGEDVVAQFSSWQSCLDGPGFKAIHAGVPVKHTDQNLSPMEAYVKDKIRPLKNPNHWATIRNPFLDTRNGHGTCIIHGHTPTSLPLLRAIKHRHDLRQCFDKSSSHGRICLDGGSGKGIGIAGLMIYQGQMTLFFSKI